MLESYHRPDDAHFFFSAGPSQGRSTIELCRYVFREEKLANLDTGFASIVSLQLAKAVPRVVGVPPREPGVEIIYPKDVHVEAKGKED